MIELLTLLIDVLNILFEFYLFLSPLQSVREKKFTIKATDLFDVLEKFGIGFGEFFFLLFLLEVFLFLINTSALELLLLKLFVSLLLLSFFEVFRVVYPFISPLLALLILIICSIFFRISWMRWLLPLGSTLALIFIFHNSSWVIVMAPFDDIEVIFLILLFHPHHQITFLHILFLTHHR